MNEDIYLLIWIIFIQMEPTFIGTHIVFFMGTDEKLLKLQEESIAGNAEMITITLTCNCNASK